VAAIQARGLLDYNNVGVKTSLQELLSSSRFKNADIVGPFNEPMTLFILVSYVKVWGNIKLQNGMRLTDYKSILLELMHPHIVELLGLQDAVPELVIVRKVRSSPISTSSSS
jgi:hypothetical protein